MKLTSFNPVKLFAFCFVQKSQLSSKQGLEALGLPLIKSGKQFNILNKGRQIYQQYQFRLYSAFDSQPHHASTCQVEDKDLIRQELFNIHATDGLFGSCTLDVINKIAELLTEHAPGVIKCQKRYKLLILKIKDIPSLEQSVARRYADRFTIVLRNR